MCMSVSVNGELSIRARYVRNNSESCVFKLSLALGEWHESGLREECLAFIKGRFEIQTSKSKKHGLHFYSRTPGQNGHPSSMLMPINCLLLFNFASSRSPSFKLRGGKPETNLFPFGHFASWTIRHVHFFPTFSSTLLCGPPRWARASALFFRSRMGRWTRMTKKTK